MYPWTTSGIAPDESPNLLRQVELHALEVAKLEVGRGETTGNNAGPDIDRYRRGVGRGAWCAAFVSYCYERAADSQCLPLPFVRSHGAQQLFRRMRAVGGVLELPRPGAVICWGRGKERWMGHVGICYQYDDFTDTLLTIEGNWGPFPAKVAVRPHRVGDWRKRLRGIVSIAC